MKNETVTIRLTNWEKRILQENAKKFGLSVSQFITFNLIYNFNNDFKK